MKFEIKHRFTNSVLFSFETESLKLCVEAAVKGNAYLSGANLSGAYLSGAYLSGADLSGADLSGANLRGADGINKNLCTPLRILLEQEEKLRAYKLLNKKEEGVFNGGLKYPIGKMIEVDNADTDENIQCSTGINLATLDWCMKEWKQDYIIRVCEFDVKDIATIPTGTDGKFRVKRCVPLYDKDLKELGLI